MSRVKEHFEKGFIAWLLLFVLSLGITGWYGVNFASKFYNYNKVSGVTPSSINAWGIAQIKEGKFAVYAKYSYSVDGHFYGGKTIFDRIIFPNEIAAREYLNDWKRQSWDVFFDPHQPQSATLQRDFPVKPGIHFIIALVVTGYFIYLRRYVLSFNLS